MPAGDWLYDTSANKFNNTYFRDYYGVNNGIAVDISGDLVVRGKIRNEDTDAVDISGDLIVRNGSIVVDVPTHNFGNSNVWLSEYSAQSGSQYVGKYWDVNANNTTIGIIGGMEIENTTLGGSYSQKLHFHTHRLGNSVGRRLTIDENGYVGIGQTQPRAVLEVVTNANGMLISNAAADTGNARDTINGWAGNGLILGPSVYNDHLYWYGRSNNGTKYYWQLGGSVLFTGQHLVYPENMNLKTNLSDYVGLIVSSSNTGYTSYYIDKLYTGKEAIRSCEALPNCKLTSIEKDKSVFGVITNQENDKYFDTDGNNIYDNVDEGFEKNIKDRLRVNSVGEGAIWICNKNGNFDNGDYITSSSVPGYGVKQDDDILHNYTVAKITMSCDFNPQQVQKKKILQHESMDESGNTILDESGNAVLINTMDEDGNLQRVDEIDENRNVIYHDSYEIRYLDLQGARLTKAEYDTKLANGEQVYISAFVGCTYHCG